MATFGPSEAAFEQHQQLLLSKLNKEIDQVRRSMIGTFAVDRLKHVKASSEHMWNLITNRVQHSGEITPIITACITAYTEANHKAIEIANAIKLHRPESVQRRAILVAALQAYTDAAQAVLDKGIEAMVVKPVAAPVAARVPPPAAGTIVAAPVADTGVPAVAPMPLIAPSVPDFPADNMLHASVDHFVGIIEALGPLQGNRPVTLPERAPAVWQKLAEAKAASAAAWKQFEAARAKGRLPKSELIWVQYFNWAQEEAEVRLRRLPLLASEDRRIVENMSRQFSLRCEIPTAEVQKRGSRPKFVMPGEPVPVEQVSTAPVSTGPVSAEGTPQSSVNEQIVSAPLLHINVPADMAVELEEPGIPEMLTEFRSAIDALKARSPEAIVFDKRHPGGARIPVQTISQEIVEAIIDDIMIRHFNAGNFATAHLGPEDEVFTRQIDGKEIKQSKFAVPVLSPSKKPIPRDDSIRPLVTQYIGLLNEALETARTMPEDYEPGKIVVTKLESHKALMDAFLSGGKPGLRAALVEASKVPRSREGMLFRRGTSPSEQQR